MSPKHQALAELKAACTEFEKYLADPIGNDLYGRAVSLWSAARMVMVLFERRVQDEDRLMEEIRG